MAFVKPQGNLNSISNKLAIVPDFGHTFYIVGRSTRNAAHFEINFSNDKGNTQTIPFHMSFRFAGKILVLNSKVRGAYLQEERLPMNALRPGDEFRVLVFVGRDRFNVSLNDTNVGEFSFRDNLKHIWFVNVNNDVDLISQLDHRQVFPMVQPPIQTRQAWFSFTNDLPIAFRPGHIFVAQGIPSGNSRGFFVIRFQVSHTEKTALHFAARFDQNMVIRTNNHNDKQQFLAQEEDRSGRFPFAINTPFKIAFAFTTTKFLIAVNGSFFCEYPYKGSINAFTGIKCSENDGLMLKITDIDNIILPDTNARGFEAYSRL